MKLIHANYNMHHNSIGITTFNGYILRIDSKLSCTATAVRHHMDRPCAKCNVNRQSN